MVTTFGFVVLAISLLHSIPNVRCQRNLEKRQESGNSVIDKFDISNSDVEINEDSIHNASLNSKGIALDAAAVTPEDVSLANRVFEFLDMDGDGALVDLELENWLMMMDIPLTPEENILEKIGDVDGDGKITYKEFEHHNNHAIEENDPLRFLRNLNPAQTEVPSEMASSSSYELTENLNLHLRKKRAASERCYDDDKEDIGCFDNSLSYEPAKNFSILFKVVAGLEDNYTLPLPEKDLPVYLRMSTRNVSAINEAKTVFLVHGFWSDSKSWEQDMKHALLEADPWIHVITVDWSKGANPGLLDKFTGKWYSQAVANTRVVGAKLGWIIKKYSAANDVDMRKIHIIGHSLGAHIAGYAGDWLRRNIDAKLGRITGMDPAGPLFDGMPAAVRLDPTDAVYVDVIHTDTDAVNGYGIPTPIGHADFYPNGGTHQPGCSRNSLEALETLALALALAKGGMSCSHGRAYKLMIDSITNRAQPMVAFAADSYEQYESGERGSRKNMGYFTSTETYRDEPIKYYLDTNKKEPYATGPEWTTWTSVGGCNRNCDEGTVLYSRICEGRVEGDVRECDGDSEKLDTCNLRRCKWSHPQCVFPFNYKGVIYNECTTVDYGSTFWCSFSAVHSIFSSWAECTQTGEECLNGYGRDYRGSKSKGESYQCLNWSTHAGQVNTDDVLEEEGDHNYCRNPDNHPFGPWCWIGKRKSHFCLNIPDCTKNEYLGCFEDKEGDARDLPRKVTHGLNNDIVGCINKCKEHGYAYAGMQFGDECWCGNRARRKWGIATGCNMKCSGNKYEICGGAWRNSIYKTSYDWRYVGCFKDNGGKDRDLPKLVYNGVNHIDWCISECKSAKYVYAGLQNGDECWCGNSAERKWGSATGCDMECSGNKYQICGGAWRNSIYRTSYEDPKTNH